MSDKENKDKDIEIDIGKIKEENEAKSDNNNFLSESYLSKFAKTGLLALGASILFKGKTKNTELVKTAVVSAGVMALSNDDDYSKDAVAIASFYGIKHSASLAKYLLKSDTELFNKAYKYAGKADDVVTKFNLVNANLFNKAKDTVGKNILEYSEKHENKSAGIVGSTFNIMATIGYGLGKTVYDSVSFLAKNGIRKSADNIIDNSVYNKYKSKYKDFSFKDLEVLSKDISDSFGIDITNTEAGSIADGLDNLLSSLKKYTGLGTKYTNYKEEVEQIRKAKKFQRIENNSFFADIFGMYSKQENGKTVARMDKIINDKAHIAEPLSRLARDFESKQTYISKEVYQNASKEIREELFVKYLKDNGFGEVVDNFYKKDNLINFKDVENMVRYSEIDDFLNVSRKSSTSFMQFNKNEFVGIKNIDLLGNFGFTNVVKKGADGNIIDETTLDGTMTFIRALGAIEKNNIAAFKIPILEKRLNTWNPLKVIESDARIKNKVANDILGFAYNKHGYFLNGMHITENIIEKYNETSKKMHYITEYKTNGRRDAKVVFNQRLLNVLTEDFSVDKKTAKKGYTYSDIYHTTKEQGIKQGFSQFTHSRLNPFSFRYDKGEGFKLAKESEGYFTDGSIFSTLFNKADININKLRAENRANEHIMDRLTDTVINVGVASSLKTKEGQLTILSEINSLMTQKIGDAQKALETLDENLIKKVNQVSNRLATDPKFAKHETRINVINSLFNKNTMDEEEAKKVVKFLSMQSTYLDIVNNFDQKTITKHKVVNDYFKRKIADPKFIFNEIFKEKFADVSETMASVQKLVIENAKSQKKFKEDFNNLLHNKTTLYNNFIDNYLRSSNITDPANVFNVPYEVMKGHYINQTFKKSNITEEVLQELKDYKILQNNQPEVMGTFLKELKDTVKNSLKKDKKMLHTDSYKIYDELTEETMKLYSEKMTKTFLDGADPKSAYKVLEEGKNSIKKLNFSELVEMYNDLKYIKNEEVSSSAIIRKTEFDFTNVKGILKDTRNFIFNLLANKKTSELDNEFNIHVKMSISNLQGALEFIGIERLTQEDLGKNGFQQIYNFMKKRYVPLALMVGGALAVDSASDAFIPDSVPVIGNGISGTVVKGVATARVGAQYLLKGTGMLSLLRGLDNMVPGLIDNTVGNSLDLLMDPSEMIDVYFNGKPIEVKANRWWFTAGRQSGEGEEFKQYRPHLWYIWQNKDAGVYSNKITKFFRRDFAFTKYPWYILDPYKEEREAYQKYGAVYPMTEQLFTEVPVIGQLLNATVGEVIKPTQLIGKEQWKVGENLMKNPNYNPNDESSPKYIKYDMPNKFIKSVFEAVEDLKTFAGLEGYTVTKITEKLFGATNPYQDKVGLSSIDQDTGLYARYDRLQLGDLFGMTEPVRRLLDDSNALGMINMNPLEQKLPDWMPEYFKKGNNPYLSWDFGNYILPGQEFENSSNNHVKNDELNKFRTLALTAPHSKDFKSIKQRLIGKVNEFSKKEQTHYYESLAFAEHYGEREYLNSNQKAEKVESIELKIDKKISPTEFISKGKRYKIDTVTEDFNKLSKRYGSSQARKMMNELNEKFEIGSTHTFKISKNATFSVGIDEEGDYFKIDSDEVSDKYDLDKSSYRKSSSILGIVAKPFTLMQNSPMPIPFEKVFGTKNVYNEWSAETVQAPFFRDWDTPISSFVSPFYTYSSNSFTSAKIFDSYANEIYMNGNGSFNLLGTLNKLGSAKLVYNKISGNTTVSDEYNNETKVHDELEKIKFIAGDKSYYNMTGKEKLKQFEEMVNEQDAVFLKDLANVSNESEREKILNSGNERIANVLKTIWNRHQMALDNNIKYDDVETKKINNVIDVGAYYGNSEEAKNRIKSRLNISLSKLDAKRQGVFNAHRGIEAEREADFIYHRMYRQFHQQPTISSTIYNNGIININSRGENY